MEIIVFISVIILLVFFIVRSLLFKKRKNVNNKDSDTSDSKTYKTPPSYPYKSTSSTFTDTDKVTGAGSSTVPSDEVWDNDIEISCYNPVDNYRRGHGINLGGVDPLSFYNPSSEESALPVFPNPDPSTKFLITGEISGLIYHALLTYFPENKYKKAPSNVINDRNTVFGFKDGMNWMKVSDKIHDALINEYSSKLKNWNCSNVVFVVIPSSTRQKTSLRYASLCERISARFGISNGYKAISVKKDREPLKGKTGIDKTANLNYDKTLFEKKYVFLFDDIKTSGESFIQNAKKLKNLGAKEVRGIFLGETYDSCKYGEPSWMGSTAKTLAPHDDDLLDLPF